MTPFIRLFCHQCETLPEKGKSMAVAVTFGKA
jgi:hypothetical protein